MEREEEGRRSKEKGSFCWTAGGSLRCVEARQRSGSEGLGSEGWFLQKDRRKEKSEGLGSRELSYVCDLPLRLIGS